MSNPIELSSTCVECGGFSPHTEDYKQTPIFTCQDCGWRFGLIKSEDIKRTPLEIDIIGPHHGII